MKNIFFILIISFGLANLVAAQKNSEDGYVEGNYTEDELWGEDFYEYDVYNSNDANNVDTKAQPSTGFGTISFEVLGAKSDEGKISASLYSSAVGFPSNPEASFQRTVIELSNGSASGGFENVPYGQYAS